jgi:uncharacterized protein YraI
MRATAYLIGITSFLSVLIVFATMPAMAAAPEGAGTSMGSPPPMNGQSNQTMTGPRAPMMGQKKAEVSGGAMGQNPGGDQAMAGSQQVAAKTGSPAGPKGGEGVVVSVDQPENCLRIRGGPGSNFPMIGCATRGQKLQLTGVFSSDGRWAQLQNKGWVYLSQIQTDLVPPRSVASSRRPPRGYSSEGPWRGPAGSSYYNFEEPEPYYEEVVPYGGFYYRHPWRWRHHRWHGGWGGHHGGGHHH